MPITTPPSTSTVAGANSPSRKTRRAAMDISGSWVMPPTLGRADFPRVTHSNILFTCLFSRVARPRTREKRQVNGERDLAA
ncbi:hypothetical protein GCM10009643_26700 [Microbacterium aurantiacum]